MLIRYGYRITIGSDQPLPLVTLMTARPERRLDLRAPEVFRTDPGVPFSVHTDIYGNLRMRMTAPAGDFTLESDATIADHGLFDPVCPDAQEMPVPSLPDEALHYLTPSRYCETDLLYDAAWHHFGQVPAGWARVQAVNDFVHGHLRFSYPQADTFRTAKGAYDSGLGVCRDYAHLAIAFCRCLNIPARYVFGHLGDIGIPAPPDPMDFCAWMEVWLSGRWWTFDPRNNRPRIGRIKIGHGRDAADTPMLTTFGGHVLKHFEVWTDEVDQNGNPVPNWY